MQIKFDEIPVSKRLNETVETSLEQIKREQRRKKRKKLWIGCGSAAAAFAVSYFLLSTFYFERSGLSTFIRQNLCQMQRDCHFGRIG